ncbi:MAG: lysophospholipid acyltransferase family protein [Candidatus Omnitrophica bacterium]|nr:lysophospholipid acyltransferase family protein [Candidatus Omnitrophota bacterium]
MIQYFLYKFGLFIIHFVPRAWSYRFAEYVAHKHYRDSVKDREAVIHNLEQITGRKDGHEAEAEKVFLNFGRYLVDFFSMYKMVDRKFVDERVTFVGLDNLDQALAAGKGGIILTAHIGNWEMGAAVLDKLGHPVTAIALPHKNPKVNILFNKQREAHGVHVVPTTSAVRRCMEALRKGRLVAVLGDRDFGSFGMRMDFLGRETLIPKGAAFFACRTGAPIIPSFLTPDGCGRYTMVFGAPIFPPQGVEKNDEAAMADLIRQYVPVIERKIKEDPTQWLMFREFGVEFENMYSDTRL